MHDSDGQANVNRIEERNQCTAGWVSCRVSTLLALGLIATDWSRRTLLGKVAALAFLLFLAVFPMTVFVGVRAGKQVNAGWVFPLGVVPWIRSAYAGTLCVRAAGAPALATIGVVLSTASYVIASRW
jgi:hypothetical protein